MKKVEDEGGVLLPGLLWLWLLLLLLLKTPFTGGGQFFKGSDTISSSGRWSTSILQEVTSCDERVMISQLSFDQGNRYDCLSHETKTTREDDERKGEDEGWRETCRFRDSSPDWLLYSSVCRSLMMMMMIFLLFTLRYQKQMKLVVHQKQHKLLLSEIYKWSERVDYELMISQCWFVLKQREKPWLVLMTNMRQMQETSLVSSV